MIGVPLTRTPLAGQDALLATVQMPSGIPVATMAIGAAGAKNAAILAAQILGTSDPDVEARLKKFKKKLASQVEKKAEALQNSL